MVDQAEAFVDHFKDMRGQHLEVRTKHPLLPACFHVFGGVKQHHMWLGHLLLKIEAYIHAHWLRFPSAGQQYPRMYSLDKYTCFFPRSPQCNSTQRVRHIETFILVDHLSH